MSEVINKTVDEATQVAIMDQCPTADVPARSPLAHQDQSSKVAPQNPGVFLWEDALKTHLVLRGDANNADFRQGIEAATGLDLPEALQSTQSDDWALGWIAPDEWLLTGPGDQAFAMETTLRKHLSGHYAVINVSGGQTLVRLAGPEARSVLMKSCPYDVHDRNFPIGKIVNTVLAKSQATIRRLGENDWELVVRRSFADYIWRWLMDASGEYGLHLGQPDAATAARQSNPSRANPVEG
ncbi:sarcosine oxidase subunit gamma [Saccharospirillum salsuginis]|uniref:Sarcosine oxidase subunit gamma n=1 Tax=Saccharospirillum salsuginis TaxID=418750 RepID=A0A918KBM4_9GAMM|nr:sarcosine oxidase subunit gamma family protein [Saccharospirillum salsuginis]GGX57105.1 sarcosine oxidase subunit gamma [Saccharospirillum salsuginis]